MATIDIKLKTYEQLQFEIIKMNTDIYLKDKEIERLKDNIEILQNDLDIIGKELGLEEGSCFEDVLDKIEKLNNIINEKEAIKNETTN